VPGTIRIGFELYPHTDTSKPQLETIIAQEGGPGYSTTGSRTGYVRLLTPLRDRRDILLIDKRGTGRSQAIDCPRLQKARVPTLAEVRECGAQLGDTAWLYGSDFAADDVAAVLRALQTGKVDYYGDSYATFFGQVFAVRHPDLLRTLVLDSAYPVLGEHGYFASEIENFPVALEKACARSAPCASLGPSVTERFGALLNALRAQPVTGQAPGANGELRTVTADAGALFVMVYTAGDTLISYRDIDAAGRDYLGSGDAVPLLRLVAEAEDDDAGGGLAKQFSVGLATAVDCSDYRQLFDMRANEAARRREFDAAIANKTANDPNVYAPFTIAEALGAYGNPEVLNTCTVWPSAPSFVTPGYPVPVDAVFPKIPVLVLSGELDTVTSPKEGAETTALFSDALFVVMHNTGHETAIGDGGVFVPPYGGDLARCAQPIVLHFIASGGDAGDTSCALHVRPIRTVPDFVLGWQAVAPASALPGNQVNQAGLSLAAAASATVGDALARSFVTTSGRDRGLRGGMFRLHPDARGKVLDLDALQWTQDLAVSGQLRWNQLNGDVTATVALTAQGHDGTVTIAWNDRQRDATASLTGTIDGQVLKAEQLAP
jgi:pimeloyl-ACP methyl ester carboxylesterase